MTASGHTDGEIAKSVQNGDIESFGILVERYEAKMVRYAGKFLFGYRDAGDIVQDVFLKACVNIQSFDPRRSFSAWLYRIAHNEFINAIKKRGREPLPFFDPDTLFPHHVATDNPQKDLQDRELKQLMEKSLSELAPKYREPLVLYYFEGLNYRQISEILRLPVRRVPL